MNWKEHANLFANGKFKSQINWKDSSRSIKDINGYFNLYPFEHDFLDGKDYLPAFDLTNTAIPIENCTLIARKIEDMTDEEKSKIQECRLDSNFERGVTNKFLDYLSFGVLPPQFEWDETVIDIKTL